MLEVFHTSDLAFALQYLYLLRQLLLLYIFLGEHLDVRQGKYIEVTIDEEDTDIAKQKLNQMCEKLLANLVIEDYSVEIK